MELPKNITQIGEANQRCKIYVEDYVVSYMKQLNQVARDKDMAVALYGICKEENEVSYLFLYGACKLDFLQKETRHLSQAQQQEIEKYRVKYFPDYIFLGYRLLNGEMIEGVHVCEQEICRYISGYAQFYEKNDSMLAYMLDTREEVQPEVLSQEKYDEVKKRQEERRSSHEEKNVHRQMTQTSSKKPRRSIEEGGSMRGMRYAVVAMFVLLCLAGVSSLNGEEGVEGLQAMAKNVMSQVMEKQLPDAQEGEIPVDTLIAEDKLANAILQENETLVPDMEEPLTPDNQVQQASAMGKMEEEAAQPAEAAQTAGTAQTTEAAQTAGTVQTTEAVQSAQTTQTETLAQPEQNAVENIGEDVAEEPIAQAAVIEPTPYVIQEGDTLIGICVLNYGNDARISEICSLNQIENPDDIKVGQKILLP